MGASSKPQLQLAEQTLPSPLLQSLRHVFLQRLNGCVLAGGTALSGFYAGHRKSDDLDLFTENESAHRSAVLAVKSLTSIGVELKIQNESSQYFDGTGKLEDHLFKVTVVLDSNLFRVGSFVKLPGDIQVVDLETLFKMKAATLVSRCSEKDLYDLIWLFQYFKHRSIADLIRFGSEVDAGLQAESILISVSGSILRKEACDFSLDPSQTPQKIFDEIQSFKKSILKGLDAHLEAEPTPLLGELIRKLEKFRK